MLLTSNNTRELSEALKRRCLYLHIDYPDIEREKEIVRVRVPEIDEHLADQIARVVRSIRALELKKAPSISETIDWAAHAALPRQVRRSIRRSSARRCTCCSSTSPTSPRPARSCRCPNLAVPA